jgi:hypothetical protein
MTFADRFFWRSAPQAVAWLLPSLGLAMLTGLHPPQRLGQSRLLLLAFLLGTALGAMRLGFKDTFTESLGLMILLVVIGCLSGSIAAWFALGMATADTLTATLFSFIGDPSHLRTFAEISDAYNLRYYFFRLGVLSIEYALLFSLSVFIPQIAGRFAAAIRLPGWIARSASTSKALRTAVGAVIAGGLVFAWSNSTPTLLRPFFTWFGNMPTYAAMHAVQQHDAMLAAIAAIVMSVRLALEFFKPSILAAIPAEAHGTRKKIEALIRHRQGGPLWKRSLIQIIATTFMLSGLLASWLDAALVIGAQAIVIAIRYQLASRFSGLVRFILMVPVLLRVGLWLGSSFASISFILRTLWYTDSSFRPILWAVAASLLLFAVLFPAANKRPTAA